MPICPNHTTVPEHISATYGVPAGSAVACRLPVGHEGMCQSEPLGDTSTRMLFVRGESEPS